MVKKPAFGTTVYRVCPSPPEHKISPVVVECCYKAARKYGGEARLRVRSREGALWDVFANSCFRTMEQAVKHQTELTSADLFNLLGGKQP